jgi:hypothetical protein
VEYRSGPSLDLALRKILNCRYQALTPTEHKLVNDDVAQTTSTVHFGLQQLG